MHRFSSSLLWRKFNKVPFSTIYRYMQSLKREREKRGKTQSALTNTQSHWITTQNYLFFKKAQNYLSTFVSTLEKWLDFYLEKGKFPTSATAHSQFLHQSQLRSWSQIISKNVHKLKKVIKSKFSYCFSIHFWWRYPKRWLWIIWCIVFSLERDIDACKLWW